MATLDPSIHVQNQRTDANIPELSKIVRAARALLDAGLVDLASETLRKLQERLDG